MNCAELLRTQAFIDGELDDTAARDAERHLQDCAECQAFVAQAAMAGDIIRTHAASFRAPDHLRREILRSLKAPRSESFMRLLGSREGRNGFWLGAGSAGGVIGLVAALLLFAILPPSAASLSVALIDAHTQALTTGREIQVVSSSHHTVKPWFAGRIAISPPVADFDKQGFTLAGGRVEKIAGVEMAVVVYRHGAHEIDLFVWADNGSRLPGMTVRHGFHLLSWKNGDLGFAAVSDMESAEFEEFARLVRSEPE